MTIANTCVLIAALLPIATVGTAKFSAARLRRSQGGYDNHSPRAWMARLEGWKARAVAAQNNGFESLPLFAFAVLAAELGQVAQSRTDTLAISFIVLRLVYVGLYLADQAALRSLVWVIGQGVAIAILAPTLG